MTMAYNFQIIEDCLKCTFREHRLFCDLSREALIRLQAIKATSVYPKGALLCLEGQPPRGIFVLCTGRAKLSTTSSEGKSMILRIAEPGEVLGLTAVVSGTPYEATVETLEPSQANFISQAEFLRFIQEYPDVGLKSRPAAYAQLQMCLRRDPVAGSFQFGPGKTRQAHSAVGGTPAGVCVEEVARNSNTRNADAGRNRAIDRHLS